MTTHVAGQLNGSTMPVPARGAARRSIDRPAIIGLAVLLVIVGGCMLGVPWAFGSVGGGDDLERLRFEAGNLEFALRAPMWSADGVDSEMADTARSRGEYVPAGWLGTDRLGRDVLARCLAGGVISLAIGFSAALLTVVIGTLYGALSGAVGGRFDAVMMRVVDVLYGLPTILLVVLLAVAVDALLAQGDLSTVERQGINVATLLVAIGGVSWLTVARVIRGQVLSLRGQPFMEACRALGVGPTRQFIRHLLPNLVGPIVVYATLAVPTAILSESFLSFLGIGVRAPLPSWGNLAADALSEVNTVESRWWLLAWPCVLIAATLLALNFVGDHLRARFDPISSRS